MSNVLQRGKRVEITGQLQSEAATTFAQWIGCFGVVWNCKVAEDESAYRAWVSRGKPQEARPTANQAAAHFVDDTRPWLGDVPSQIRRNAASKWFEAKTAAIKGLRKNPRFRRPFGKKPCVVTSELFEAQVLEGWLVVAFKTSAGSLPFCSVRVPGGLGQASSPRSFVVSRVGARSFLSWSYEYEAEVEEEAVLVNRLRLIPEAQQECSVTSIDVGVAKPATLSDGATFEYSSAQKSEMKRLEAKKRRYQKQMARSQKGSKNRRKRRAKAARCQAKVKRIRKDFLHKTSKAIAEKAGAAIVMEDLKIVNMVRRPKARPVIDERGKVVRFDKNHAAQKAGLNAAILNVGWGDLSTLLNYKLRERNKFLALVHPHHSSQECSSCGVVDAGNRTSQASFACLSCSHAENADVNAAKVLKKRFLSELRSGKLLPKSKAAKKIAVRRKPREEGPRELRPKPVEPCVRLGSDSRQGRRSRNRPSARKACSGSVASASETPQTRSSLL